MYLMKTRFDTERLSTEAFHNGNSKTVLELRNKLNEIKTRLHTEFKHQYDEIYQVMTQQHKTPSDLDEMWILNEFSNRGG